MVEEKQIFYYILFSSIQFNSIQFYSILFYSILFYSILFSYILFELLLVYLAESGQKEQRVQSCYGRKLCLSLIASLHRIYLISAAGHCTNPTYLGGLPS
jgi:hypothetical protein